MKRALRIAKSVAAGMLALFGLAMLAVWALSSIPRNAGWAEPDSGVQIMVETNGTHTGIVMPVVTAAKDWRETCPSAGRTTPRGPVTHIAIGWGEKEIFLNTPTWGDLKPGTALRIALFGGESLLRVSHYVRPAPGSQFRPLTVSEEQYRLLVARVEAALPPLPPGELRANYPGFQPGDANYDAVGRYTLANTCNQWVGDTLAAAGVKMGLWTPFAGGVTKWVPAKSPTEPAFSPPR